MTANPVTQVSVMIPSGRIISLFMDVNNKQVQIVGIASGPINLTWEESLAIKDLLGVVFQ